MIPSRPPCTVARRAFSLVEAVIATAIVGGLLVAAMSGVGATARMRQVTVDSETGLRLAKDLLDEVLAKPYFDPSTSPDLGREAGESNRADYDDVDDYDGLVDEPPTAPDGTIITSQAGWRREVVVIWASRSDIETSVKTDEGVKRVEVKIYRRDKPICTLVATRTSAWDALLEAR